MTNAFVLQHLEDDKYSRQFTPAVSILMTPIAARVATDHEDQKLATDLVIRPMNVAIRVRRPGYFEQYPQDFTIRTYRPSGTETELAKILKGYGDALAYVHAANDNRTLRGHVVVDLRLFREAHAQEPDGAARGLWEERTNHDGTKFNAYKWRKLSALCPGIVLDYLDPIVKERGQIQRFRCVTCNAHHGQRVWRLKQDWRIYFPGDGQPHEPALYYPELDIAVDLSGSEQCAWCGTHS